MNQRPPDLPRGGGGRRWHKAKGSGLKSMRGLCVLRTTSGRAECAGPYKRNTYIYQIHTRTTGGKERGQPCTRRRSASSCRAAKQADDDAYKACTVAAPLRARADEGLQALHQPGGVRGDGGQDCQALARRWSPAALRLCTGDRLCAGHPQNHLCTRGGGTPPGQLYATTGLDVGQCPTFGALARPGAYCRMTKHAASTNAATTR